nr:RNA-directed DNA polymerase, eukaryota [Tanacetum cinerariifolium]
RSKKKRLLAICGILNDGDWIEDHALVKNEFFNPFCNRFMLLPGMSASFDLPFSNSISSIQSAHLERGFSRDEIKRAVWDCGRDHDSGPDGYSFKFLLLFGI